MPVRNARGLFYGCGEMVFGSLQKELKTFYDGTRKANLDVEIAVDMLSLAGRYDTAVLVSGDEDFVYAVNAVAYKAAV